MIHWLPETGLVQLNKDTLLLGEDCWADGLYSNYTDSRVMLNDSRIIQELREGNIIGKYQLPDAMQKLADSDAERLNKNLQLATQNNLPKKIIVLVHVPPFKESCMHEGQVATMIICHFLLLLIWTSVKNWAFCPPDQIQQTTNLPIAMERNDL